MYSPRRTVLDTLLVEAAKEAGAEIRQATTFRDLLWEGDRVVGVRVQNKAGQLSEEGATIVVGADGVWSRVARAARAAMDIEHPSLTCGYYAYWAGVPTDGVEFYVRKGRDILVFPTHGGLTCVWAGRSHSDWDSYRAAVDDGYHEILGHAPALAQRLAAATQVTPFKGTGKLPNFYRQSVGKGWALVGDAAYHRDPLVGMGIGDAFLGAQMLAEALVEGLAANPTDLNVALAKYQTNFRETTMPIFDYTLKAASLKDPSATMSLYAKVARSPEASMQFMDVLAGNLPFKAFFNPSNISRLLAS